LRSVISREKDMSRRVAGQKPGSIAKLDAEAGKRVTEGGLTPLDFLLAVMRDNHQDFRVRLDAAKMAAPYCHARLASTELSRESIEPGEPRMIKKLDITGLSGAELDLLEKVLKKTALGVRQPN
jgi:hypothetical protein